MHNDLDEQVKRERARIERALREIADPRIEELLSEIEASIARLQRGGITTAEEATDRRGRWGRLFAFLSTAPSAAQQIELLVAARNRCERLKAWPVNVDAALEEIADSLPSSPPAAVEVGEVERLELPV